MPLNKFNTEHVLDPVTSLKEKKRWDFFSKQDSETQEFIIKFYNDMNELKKQAQFIREEFQELNKGINQFNKNNRKMNEIISTMNSSYFTSRVEENKNVSFNFLYEFYNWFVSFINNAFYSFNKDKNNPEKTEFRLM